MKYVVVSRLYILLCRIPVFFPVWLPLAPQSPPVRRSIIFVLGYRSSGFRTDPGPPPHFLHSIENHK